MKIKFWGCRGSIPVPDGRMIRYGGNTACVEINVDGKILIIDAGTGIRKLGEDLTREKVKHMNIFLTHSHWDHIQGFPFFNPIYTKESHICIYGYTKSYRQIKDILSKQMSYEFFPVRFSDLKSKISFADNYDHLEKEGNFKVSTIDTNHPINTQGIRLEKNNESFVFITDNELKAQNATTPYSGFVNFCKNATFLIHDAQFTENEYKKSKGWGHSTYRQVIQLARDAEVKNLGFYHHDPNREDKQLDEIEKYFSNYCNKKKYRFKVSVIKEQDEIDLSLGWDATQTKIFR